MFLNNAATTVLKPDVYYEAAPATAEETRERIAKFLGCKNNEKVFLTTSGTEAIKAALHSFIKPGDHVISTDTEYKVTLDTLDEIGCEVTYIPVNPYGTLRYDLIEDAVKENTKAIVCCHGSNVTGNIIDLDKVGTISRRHKLMLIVDGCQTIGATPINLDDLSVDVFCFTGHKKLMGPYGTGGLVLRQHMKLDPQIADSLQMPSEEKLGKLCASIDFINEKGIYGVTIFPHRLAKRFFEATQSMDAVKVYGDFGTSTRVPTVSISVKGHTAEEVKRYMRKQHIAVKSGDFGAPRLVESLAKDEDGLVRFSFGYFNTRMDVNDAIYCLMNLIGIDDLYLLS